MHLAHTTMFLTDDELVALTGYKLASKQVAFLRSRRIPFYTNKSGHPRVVKTVIEGGGRPKEAKKTWSPSWADDQQ
jgi:hypothetical protein